MLKYDSMHGKYLGEVTFDGSDLVIDGKTIKTYAEKYACPKRFFGFPFFKKQPKCLVTDSCFFGGGRKLSLLRV